MQGPLGDTSDEQFERLVETNLTATFRYARALFAPMRSQGGGAMVLIASDSAIRGSHRIPAYSAVKAGVVAIAELLGAEGAPHGIRVNAVCPGNTLPGMAGDDASGWRRDRERRVRDRPRMSRRPSRSSPPAEAAHINGATLRIDGAHRRRAAGRHAQLAPGRRRHGERGARGRRFDHVEGVDVVAPREPEQGESDREADRTDGDHAGCRSGTPGLPRAPRRP